MRIRIYYLARVNDFSGITENRSCDTEIRSVPDDIDNFGFYVKDEDFIEIQGILNIGER